MAPAPGTRRPACGWPEWCKAYTSAVWRGSQRMRAERTTKCVSKRDTTLRRRDHARKMSRGLPADVDLCSWRRAGVWVAGPRFFYEAAVRIKSFPGFRSNHLGCERARPSHSQGRAREPNQLPVVTLAVGERPHASIRVVAAGVPHRSMRSGGAGRVLGHGSQVRPAKRPRSRPSCRLSHSIS
jgi:hypothetical protein